MLYVPIRSARSTAWRVANVTFVAMRRVGVGPGAKTEPQRLSRKSPIVSACGYCRALEVIGAEQTTSEPCGSSWLCDWHAMCLSVSSDAVVTQDLARTTGVS